jgi:threonine dehydrogenase-like Zn-dependent dehydrogenase
MEGTMKAAWLRGLHRFDLVDVDVPRIEPDQALVKILKVGICGSDRGMWNGHHFFNDLYGYEAFSPGEHGHEASGVVVEVGPECRGVKVGDLTCRLNLLGSHDLDMRCFAEYAVADAPIVVNGADPEVVCFADPVVVALNHVYHANVTPGDTVLVMGQGFIGLLITQLLRQQHVNVVATDIREYKLGLAAQFGAVAVDARSPQWLDEVRDHAKEIQAVIECTGADEPIDAACRLVRRGGTLVIMGATRKTVTLNYTQLRIRGATVKFPMNGVNLKDNWASAAEILYRGEIEVKSLISKRDRLVNLQSVLENYEPDWLRVVLEP